MHYGSKSDYKARRHRGKHRHRKLQGAHLAGVGLQASACSSCSARQLCRSSESKEKLIEVRGHYPTLHVGDGVTLVGSVRQGLRASVIAYVVPLVLMVIALFIGTRLAGEGTGALAALLVLALYYGVLYLFRDKLGKEFAFEIVNSK